MLKAILKIHPGVFLIGAFFCGVMAIRAAFVPSNMDRQPATNVGALMYGYDSSGQTGRPLAVDGSGQLLTTAGGGSVTVVGGATAANQTLQLNQAVTTTNNTTALAANLAVANDGVDAGNPLKVGGKSVTQQSAVSAALDRIDLQMDRWGRVFTNACGPPTSQSYVSGTISESTTPVTFAAAAASTYKDLCQFTICNSGTAGTVVTLKTAATAVGAPIPLAPAGGCYTWREVYELTANQDWSITGTGTTGVTIQYGGVINSHP